MPFIEDYRFGYIRIGGEVYRNDVKVIGGVVVPEWWRAKGHVFDVADVQDILDAGPDVLVCGLGSSGQAELSSALTKRLAQDGIALRRAHTADAVQVFNRLLEDGTDVAGAFHLTC